MPTLPYPPENITSIPQFLEHANNLLSVGGVGLLGIGILIAIGFVSFLSLKSYSSERAFGFAGFITLITAIFLRFMNLISDNVMFLIAIIFIISLIFLIRERNVEESGV